MAQRAEKRMSVEEFLAWQLGQEKLYELVDGQPYLPLKSIAGATHNHDTVVVNALTSLREQLRGKPCRPKSQAIGVKIPRGNVRRLDVLIDCGKGAPSDTIATEPRVVVEVLSPSTMNFDRVTKLPEYMTVPSIVSILLVDTERPRVTVYRRRGAEWESDTIEGLDGIIDRLGMEVALPLAMLYEDVEFEPQA